MLLSAAALVSPVSCAASYPIISTGNTLAGLGAWSTMKAFGPLGVNFFQASWDHKRWQDVAILISFCSFSLLFEYFKLKFLHIAPLKVIIKGMATLINSSS